MPIPPKGVQEVARKALERRRKAPKSKKGGTAVGISRGRDLARGANISMRSIRRTIRALIIKRMIKAMLKALITAIMKAIIKTLTITILFEPVVMPLVPDAPA